MSENEYLNEMAEAEAERKRAEERFIEFDCPECGYHIYSNLDPVWTGGLCALCHHLREYVPDLEERKKIVKIARGE